MSGKLKLHCIKDYHVAIVLWFLLSVLDILTTHVGLQVGAIEGNPIFNSLAGALGETPGYGLKLFTALIVAVSLYKMRMILLLRAASLALGVIIISNIVILTYSFYR